MDEIKQCYCPDPVPNVEGTICGKCGGSNPEIKKKTKRKKKDD